LGDASKDTGGHLGGMTLYKVLAGATVTLALLSGCGGSGGGGKATASPKSQGSNSTLSPVALAQCARAHGMPDFPDPTQAPDGSWQFPPSAEGQQLPDACAALKRSLGGQGSIKAPSAADMAKLRQFAQCIRQHGISDWPDPQNDGSFTLPPRISQGGKAVTSAPIKACRQYQPAQGLIIKQ
jgi:hypothetical protein